MEYLQELIDQWPLGGCTTERRRYPKASEAGTIGMLAMSIAEMRIERPAAPTSDRQMKSSYEQGRTENPRTGHDPTSGLPSSPTSRRPQVARHDSVSSLNSTGRSSISSSSSSVSEDGGGSGMRRTRRMLDEELEKRFEKLRVPKTEVEKNAKKIGELCSVLKDGLIKRYPKNFKWEVFNSGSYYEKTKIGQPDEYDCMFTCEIRAAAIYSCVEKSKSYCALKLVSSYYWEPGDKLLTCKDEDKYICPKAFRRHFRDQIRAVLAADGLLTKYKIEIQADDGSSPAVTLLLKQGSKGKAVPVSVDIVPAVRIVEWPRPAKDWHSRWLRRIETEYIKDPTCVLPFAVAKIHPNERGKPANECLYWRLSFSGAEKQILLHADGQHSREDQPTCRKDVLRLLKADLVEFYANNYHVDKPICSYHLKTTVLELLDEIRRHEDWSTSKRRLRYANALNKVAFKIDSRFIEHYFIENENLLDLEAIDERGLTAAGKFFRDRFEYYSLSSDETDEGFRGARNTACRAIR